MAVQNVNRKSEVGLDFLADDDDEYILIRHSTPGTLASNIQLRLAKVNSCEGLATLVEALGYVDNIQTSDHCNKYTGESYCPGVLAIRHCDLIIRWNTIQIMYKNADKLHDQ